MTRRENGLGALYQKCESRYGCPPRNVDGERPKHKCKGRWFGEYDVGFRRDGERHRRTVSAATQAEVKTKLKLKLRDLDRGVGKSDERINIRTWAETWLGIVEKTNRPNTHTTDISATKWIVETIGHRTLATLQPEDVRALHSAIERVRSSSTAARYHGTLMRMLRAASLEGHHVPANVFLVKTPKAAVNDRQDIPVSDCLAILQVVAKLPHGSRWLFALLQGPRQGETLGLTWDELNDVSVTYAWQLQPLPYRIKRDRTSGFRIPRGYEARHLVGQMHLVRPKSKAGWRVAPLIDVMAAALESWRAMSPESPHGLVWPSNNGGPADENEDREEWHAIQGTAMVGHPEGRYYTVHEARHATGTLLLALGASEAVRIAIMGHSSIASTKAYEHVDLTEMRKALEGVATVLQLG